MCSGTLRALVLAVSALAPRPGLAQETTPPEAAPVTPSLDAVSPAPSPTTPPPPPAAPVRYRLWAGTGILGLGVASLGGAVYFARRVHAENNRAADLALAYEDAVIHGQRERAKEICVIFDADGACLEGELEDADAAGAAAAGNYNLTLAFGLGFSVIGAGLLVWELSGLSADSDPSEPGKAPNWRLDVTPLPGGGMVSAGWQF